MKLLRALIQLPLQRLKSSLPLCLGAVASLALIPDAHAVDLLIPDESFETDGNGSRYMSNQHTDGVGDYFQRFDIGSSAGAHPGQLGGISGIDGTHAWFGEDVDSGDNPSGGGATGFDGIVRLNDLTVTGNNNLEVAIAFAFPGDGFNDFEAADTIEIQAAFDANSGGTANLASLGSGTYVTVGRFIGNDIPGDGMVLDENLNGEIDGGEITKFTTAMTDFTFTISGTGGLPTTGDNLSVQIVANINGGNEEFAFDHIRITGDTAATDSPVLASIEAAAISYTESDPATQVTNTITVADNDSATLASGTVTILGGVPAEDALNATGVGSIVVAGNGPNSLTLTGSGSLAQYQTVLRSVTYSNTNGTNPSRVARMVNFQVNDGGNPSNGQTRNINVNGTIAGPVSLPVTEDLNSDGEGVRYTSNTFNDGSDDYFLRTAANPHTGVFGGVLYTNSAPQGGAHWAAEDVDTADNPLGVGAPGILRLADIDTLGFSNLQVTVYLADNLNGNHEVPDRIEVQTKFNGPINSTNLADSGFSVVGRFVGTGTTLRQDTNLDGSSLDVPDTGSPTLNRTFTPYTFDIPGAGSLLSVQISVLTDGGNEEVSFDHITVTGVLAGDPPVLADIEAAPAGFTEGDTPVQLSNTITATDTDSDDLEGATVTMTVGYQNGQDQLAINGALPAGITEVAFNPATGSIGLTGTATVASYQTALRQITYENTSSNPNICDRTVTIEVEDNASSSNIETRLINVVGTVDPSTLPHLEDFNTDGDGVRYTSNSFTDSNPTPGDYFERTDLNPHPGHQNSYVFTAPQSGGYFAAEDIEASGTINKLGNMGIVRLPDLAAAGLGDFQVSIYLADLFANTETGDRIEIQAAFDGSAGTDLTSGSYTTVGRFVAAGSGQAFRQDSDLDGVSSDPEDVGSPVLTPTMTKYTFDFPGTGTLLSVQVKITQNGGNEEFAFDHIEVTGSEQFPPVADLANPTNGASLTASALNTQGYIDVTFSDIGVNGLDPATITDAGAELSLSGAGVGTAVLNGAASDQGGGIFRYSFSGAFVPGLVNVEFVASSFADLGSAPNVLETESFTLTNSAPVADTDTVERYPASSIKIPLATLLAGDSDPDGHSLSVTAVTASGSGGIVTISGSLVLYDPNGLLTADTFTYTLQDSLGATTTGTVNVNLINLDGEVGNGTNLTGMEVLGDGSVKSNFAGIPGRTYRIQSSNSLAPGGWVDRATVTADALGMFSFTDPPPLPATRYYRTVQP